MTQNFITPSIIAKEALAHLENGLVVGQFVSTDYSEEFANVGDTISVRRPVRFLGQSNNLDVTSYNEDIEEGKFPLALTQTETIKFGIDPLDLTLKVENPKIQERYIKPAVTRFKDRIESHLASKYSAVWNFSGTPGTIPATFKSLGNVGVILTNGAVPEDDRYAFHPPATALELADGLKSVYVQDKAKKAFENVRIGRYANFENYESVHMPVHVPGVGTGTPLVNGASQNVTYQTAKDTNTQSLITDGWTNSTTGIVKAGDVFTIAGVYAVNPISKQSTGALQNFVVMADANSGATTGPATITIAPAIITSGPYQTVSAVPADNAVITMKTGTGGTSYPQSMLMHKNALVLVTRPLSISNGMGVKTSTQMGNKVSISVTEWVDPNTLRHNFRLDMLFEAKMIYPDLAARLTA